MESPKRLGRGCTVLPQVSPLSQKKKVCKHQPYAKRCFLRAPRHKTPSLIIAAPPTYQTVRYHMPIGASVAPNDRYMQWAGIWRKQVWLGEKWSIAGEKKLNHWTVFRLFQSCALPDCYFWIVSLARRTLLNAQCDAWTTYALSSCWIKPSCHSAWASQSPTQASPSNPENTLTSTSGQISDFLLTDSAAFLPTPCACGTPSTLLSVFIVQSCFLSPPAWHPNRWGRHLQQWGYYDGSLWPQPLFHLLFLPQTWTQLIIYVTIANLFSRGLDSWDW